MFHYLVSGTKSIPSQILCKLTLYYYYDCIKFTVSNLIYIDESSSESQTKVQFETYLKLTYKNYKTNDMDTMLFTIVWLILNSLAHAEMQQRVKLVALAS